MLMPDRMVLPSALAGASMERDGADAQLVRRRPLTAQAIPFTAAVDDDGDRLNEFSHDGDVLGCPGPWLGPGARVHRDVGRVEMAQRGIEPAHGADVGCAGQPQVTVVTVRSHKPQYRTCVRPG